MIYYLIMINRWEIKKIIMHRRWYILRHNSLLYTLNYPHIRYTMIRFIVSMKCHTTNMHSFTLITDRHVWYFPFILMSIFWLNNLKIRKSYNSIIKIKPILYTKMLLHLTITIDALIYICIYTYLLIPSLCLRVVVKK